MKTCPVGPRFLDKALALKLERVAAARGVSQVARSPRGFMTVWKAGKLDSWWCRRRANFIKRHMAQASSCGRSVDKSCRAVDNLWRNGQPTRRHLALAMWAYSPSPARLASWLRRR